MHHPVGARQVGEEPIVRGHDPHLVDYSDPSESRPPQAAELARRDGREWSIGKEFLKGAVIAGIVILALGLLAVAVYFAVGQTVGWDRALDVVKGGIADAMEKIRSLKDMNFSAKDSMLYFGVPVAGVLIVGTLVGGLIAVGVKSSKARATARKAADEQRIRANERQQVRAESLRAQAMMNEIAQREHRAFDAGRQHEIDDRNRLEEDFFSQGGSILHPTNAGGSGIGSTNGEKLI